MQQTGSVSRFDELRNALKKKEREALRAEAREIRSNFPNKVPVIVKRFCKEMYLPPLEVTKFVVPEEISMSQFATVLRNKMKMKSTQAFYLMVNDRSMVSLSRSIGEVYNEFREGDGFLHITYASQDVFG